MEVPRGAFCLAPWDLEKHAGRQAPSVRKGAAGIPVLWESGLDTRYGLGGGIVMWLLADPSTKCYKDDTLLDAIALLRRLKLASFLRDQCRHSPPPMLPTLCHQCLILAFAFSGVFALGDDEVCTVPGSLGLEWWAVGELGPLALSTGGGKNEV